MTRKTRWFVFLVSTPLVALVTIGGLMGTPRAAVPQRNPHLQVFEDVLRLVLQAYVEDVNIDKVMDGAMHGLTDGLDTSSAFLQPDEVRAIDSKAALPAGDIGLVVTRQYYLRVLGVRDGSPAAKAGLQTGDYVRMIDGKPTRDMSGVMGMRMFRGQPGSKVAITVIRGNTADPHNFELVREALNGEIVKTSTVDGVARVRVSSFGPNTPAALASAFEGLAKSKAAGAVIDLRGVADGTPDDGVKAARLFVKSGTLAVLAGRDGEPAKVSANPGDGAIALPVVLLVSNGTANAAEVFAAALSGNARAELVGEPTAGVAAVQKLVKLPDDYGLWLTYQRYMTVDGTNPIHERGLPPAVAIANPVPGFDELPPATDAPLAKAIERLKAKKTIVVPRPRS
jgi:carboxyl-terminal processing protease